VLGERHARELDDFEEWLEAEEEFESAPPTERCRKGTLSLSRMNEAG
jgi:hypothetical protein